MNQSCLLVKQKSVPNVNSHRKMQLSFNFQIILLALVAAETTPVPLGWSTKHEAQP